MATPRKLTVTDAHLAEALAGRAYLLFDGGMGTLVQAAGLHTVHEVPDLLNLTHPDEITAIQRRYVEAGADCLTTNTFSANRLKLAGTGATVAEVYAAAAANARAAGARLVAGDVGPTGALLEPLGTLAFEEAYDIFAEQAHAAEAAGCDLIVVETMADLLEAKAAVLAAAEATALPVFATMTFGEDGRTFLGTTPAIAATTLSSLGASAVGLNCSLGPTELAPLVREMAPHNRALVMAQPNAGLPRIEAGETVFDVGPRDFAQAMEAVLDAGATIVGGCCGTTPDHIAALRAVLDRRIKVSAAEEAKELRAGTFRASHARYRPAFTVTSAQQMAALPSGEARIAVIGERINPTGKKKLKAALQAGDVDYLVAEAAAQQRAGADILDVNVGVPGLDEPALLSQVTRTLQSTVPLPLQLDSSDPAAIEAAARAYAGRPMVNSVNGKADNLAAVLPVVARYGCTVVGLTLDESGIPPTAEERLAIAERIVDAAEAHGIPREDVAIDCLVMAAATNQREVREILRAVALVKERLGVRTVLGVSNVSFGLPARPLVNSTFLAAAFGAGLDMPILNPLNARYRDTVATFRILNGQDAGCRAFLEDYANAQDPYEIAASGACVGGAPVGGNAAVPGYMGGNAAAPGRASGNMGANAAAPGRMGGNAAVPGYMGGNAAAPGQASGNMGANAAAPGRMGGNAVVPGYMGGNAVAPGQASGNMGANAAAPGRASGNMGANAAAPGRMGGNAAVPAPVGADLVAAGICPIPISDAFAAIPETVAALAEYVLEGRGAPVAATTEALLATYDGLVIINDIFVPILDVVGQKYDDGTFFLPQLMASAEAVKAGFDLIRDHNAAVSAPSATSPAGCDLSCPSAPGEDASREGGLTSSPAEGSAVSAGSSSVGGGLGRPHFGASERSIIVATVQGDIHDIGKNIVKMLLENYGFSVIDLGRDVAPETVVDAARESGARLIGLSALMTTTVGAMERTIKLVHEQLPGVAVMVGGAVITQEFADQISADFYAKDAAASTRIASAFFEGDPS
ncbi:homocysteine S-methyltransferase family protein [Adlercreutzia sp. R25]|uniref:homocysteine S-methyltransferase family protein n=1 Tax=Adlercreutzia shanghongiae TaxID=3111773 RepID=UPI002DBBE782|nr:homocysteine S-methyltransferase family protein [Adlercreutzia sp. R25]MEC4273013.1 homocysteine S-methyltransferase family protein [Adlercreutzia sp. R25]